MPGQYLGVEEADNGSPDEYAEAPFTGRATEHLNASRRALQRRLNGPECIGVVDSGLVAGTFGGRAMKAIDLGGDAPVYVPAASTVDVVGHGTRVARILEMILPRQCSVRMAMLGPPVNVTAGAVAIAMTCCAEGLPNEPPGVRPSVVSMSLLPILEGKAPSAHQSILVPFMATRYPSVAFVMAAGNHKSSFTPPMDAPNFYYGIALNERMDRAEYSASPVLSDHTVCAFGGSNADPFFQGSGRVVLHGPHQSRQRSACSRRRVFVKWSLKGASPART